MKYLHLIWAALMRSKTRTLLTMLSVVTAFLLFGMLDSVRVAFNSSANVAGYDRMIVASRLSITQSLPISLLDRIQAVPGVKGVTYGNWFGGIYRDSKNFFPNFAVSPGYMAMYPEYAMTPAQIKAFESERTGAVVGKSLADRNGWKVGDTIPLQATIFPTKGSNNWSFKLAAIFEVKDAKRKGEENVLMFNWKYFDEANDYLKNQAGWFVVTLDDPSQSGQVARAIDLISENSDRETKTQTEQSFN
jgi:putative ABC transport system permease protein